MKSFRDPGKYQLCHLHLVISKVILGIDIQLEDGAGDRGEEVQETFIGQGWKWGRSLSPTQPWPQLRHYNRTKRYSPVMCPGGEATSSVMNQQPLPHHSGPAHPRFEPWNPRKGGWACLCHRGRVLLGAWVRLVSVSSQTCSQRHLLVKIRSRKEGGPRFGGSEEPG